MKKILSVLLALLMVLGLFAPMATAAGSVSIDQTGPINLTVGQTTTLTSTPASTSTNPAIWWMSSDHTTVSIDTYTGFVTAEAAGNAIITVTDNSTGDTDTIAINVAAASPTPSITISPTSGTVQVGSAITFTATPQNVPSGATVAWNFIQGGLFVINTAGAPNSITLTGNAPGTVLVSARILASDGTTVLATSVEAPLIVTAGTTLNITNPAVNGTTLNFGNQLPLTANVAVSSWTVSFVPDGVTIGTAPQIINGTILTAGTASGTATVTATASVGGATQSRTILIRPGISIPWTTNVPIAVNTSRTLTATVPNSFPQPAIRFDIVGSTDNTNLPAITRIAPTITSNPLTGTFFLNAGNRTGTVTIRASAPTRPDVADVDFTVQIISANTVTFNLNGGTWPTSGLVQSTGNTFQQAINAVQIDGAPRRLGFTFAGWWTTPLVGGSHVNGNTAISGHTTVWARWSFAGNTTTVPAGSTVRSIFPDTNLATRVAASLSTTFNTPVTVNTRIFASDLATVQTLNLTRFLNQPITDLRGIPTLTGVRSVVPSNGLTNQNITLPAVARTSPLNHTNVVRGRDGAFINPTTISNNGAIQTTTPANSTIRWNTVPANVSSLSYAWSVSHVQIGNQTVSFSGTATLPIRGASNFVDVNSNHWFFNAVNFVVAQGYMEGTSAITFEPNRTLTRAEVAVILYRMAGEPAVSGVSPFTDVTAAWQRSAIIWASRNGIVNGIGGNRFAPERTVTREEFAAMLHRFTVHNNISVSIPGSANLNLFPDRGNVSSWAVQYMTWATHRGLITGTSGGRLNPLGTTTRAECAQMIQRYATTIIW